MDARSPRRGTGMTVAAAIVALTTLFAGTPADAAPAAHETDAKIFLDYYEGHHRTAETKRLTRALTHLDDPLRAPNARATVGKVTAVGYAPFGFDCGVLVTHRKGDGAKHYGVAIFTWGRLDTPAKNALDYPTTPKSDPRHVDVRRSHQTAVQINALLARAYKACS